MRQYLATIHEKPPTHKKRFALVTAGSFTFLIFAIWALATFGPTVEPTTASANRAVQEVTPLNSLMRGIGAGFRALIGTTGEIKEGLETVNFENGYQEMRENTLNNYGQ